MKNKYIVDSNILIDYARGYRPIINFIDKLLSDKNFIIGISGITELELYSGKSMGRPEIRKKIDYLLGRLKVFSVSRMILRSAGELIRLYEIEVRDAIIAATVVQSGYVLVTRNKKHFQKVPDLKILSP